MVTMIWNVRGSVWNRWDPHLHAPGTLLTDHFKGDWEAYLSAVENSSPRIRALGVTSLRSLVSRQNVPVFGDLVGVDFTAPSQPTSPKRVCPDQSGGITSITSGLPVIRPDSLLTEP